MGDVASETPPLEVEPPPVDPPEVLLPIKKKGRPPGSTDAAPRTRRPNIRIEPLRIDTPRPEKDAVAPVVAEPIPTPEPQTPRSALRDAHAHVMNMRNEYKNSRRTAMATAYSSKLCQWDVL